MKKTLLILVSTIILLFASVSPAAAYVGSPRQSKGEALTFCIQLGFSASQRNQIVYWVEEFDTLANALTITYSGATSGAGWAACDLRFKWGSNQQFNSLTNDITLTSGNSWTESPTNCRQGYSTQCPPYAKAAVQHEFGHFLGFSHHAGSCERGYWLTLVDYVYYYSYETAEACTWGGERLMYTNAADGYWRELLDDYDAVNGVNAWYDW